MDFRQSGALRNTIAAVRCDIQEILQSGQYYMTEEIAQELSLINNALEHLSLDDTFLATSKEWQKNPGNYGSNETAQHLSGALAAVCHVATNIQEFKLHFANKHVDGKQENQLREAHHWAITSLKNSMRNLEPYTFDSADRIKQFGDALGVTDRYTGYRQNLTRGTRDPVRMQMAWMDKEGELGLMNNLTRSHAALGNPVLDQRVQNRTVRLVGEPSIEFSEFGGVPPANIGAMKKQIRYSYTSQPMRITRGYRTIDSLYPKSTAPMSGGAPLGSSVMDEVKTLNALNACDFYTKMDKQESYTPTIDKLPYQNMSVQEQVGINTAFPGKTEYMVRFTAPDTDVPTSDFKINPTPDFTIYGRPMEIACHEPSFTEYQTRYQWPDGDKINKQPWLRN